VRIFILLVISLSFLALAGGEEKKYLCSFLKNESVFNGKTEGNSVWDNIPAGANFNCLGGHSLADKQTSFKMGYTAEALYIAIKCQEPEMDKIKASSKDEQEFFAEPEDRVEVFLFPKETEEYYQFAVNAADSRWNGMGGAPRSLGNWQAQVYKGENCWLVEIKIPFEIFRRVPEKGEVWTGNICRSIHTSGYKHASWASVKTRFHEPENFGKFVFLDEISSKALAPVIDSNLKELTAYKNEFSEAARKTPSIAEVVSSFIKKYEIIEEEIPRADSTAAQGNIFLKRTDNLLKEANKIKYKVLLEDFFSQSA